MPKDLAAAPMTSLLRCRPAKSLAIWLVMLPEAPLLLEVPLAEVLQRLALRLCTFQQLECPLVALWAPSHWLSHRAPMAALMPGSQPRPNGLARWGKHLKFENFSQPCLLSKQAAHAISSSRPSRPEGIKVSLPGANQQGVICLVAIDGAPPL